MTVVVLAMYNKNELFVIHLLVVAYERYRRVP